VISGYVRFPELEREAYGKIKKWHVNWSANISLSDCNRVIQWQLTDNEYNIAKLDRAINALSKMREFMVEAQAELTKLNAKKKKMNLALDPSDEG
jgi:hypothetical protein